MVILGELPLTEGSITVKGKIGYSSQQAWVYNGSLRQNILFGQNYDEDKFKEVTKACALDKVHVLHAVGFQKKLFFSICFEYYIFSTLLNFFVWLVHFRRSQARFHQKFVDFEVAMA